MAINYSLFNGKLALNNKEFIRAEQLPVIYLPFIGKSESDKLIIIHVVPL
ncbi:MAG: hypothetical protein ACI9LM_002749 [Alteromonadaceae bacterium]|jgi:hypothetical protein